MAELDSSKRNHLRKSSFGLPGSRKYPMPDKSHAANAKARATQMVDKGKLSSSEAAKIKSKANRVLGEGGHGSGRESAHRSHGGGERRDGDREMATKERKGWNGAKPAGKMHMAKEGEVKHVVRGEHKGESHRKMEHKPKMEHKSEHARAGHKGGKMESHKEHVRAGHDAHKGKSGHKEVHIHHHVHHHGKKD